MKKAFTLVELLIVITLISILSVAVLATINPIEQTNKARDAQFKNDAAEVLSAYERYFASQNIYPWNSPSLGFGTTVAFGTAVLLGGTDPLFGVVGPAGVGDTASELMKTSELKLSFQGKAPFLASATLNDQMYAYSNGGDNNYVCYSPKAKVNRTGANALKLKCVSVTEGVIPVSGTCLAMTDANWATPADWAPNAALANMMCVPE